MAPHNVGRPPAGTVAARPADGGALTIVLSAGLFLFPAVGAASKQAMAPLAILLAVGLLGATLRRDRRAAMPWRPVGLMFGAFLAYVAAFHLPPALGDGGVAETFVKMAMLAVVLWLASAEWTAIAAGARLDRVALWALAGLALGSLFLLVELAFDAPFHRLSDGLGPEVTVDPARHNRPAVALLLLAIPLAGLLARRVGRWPAAAALMLGATPAFAGDSAAGWLAAAVAVPVYAAGRWRSRFVVWLGAVLTAGFVVFAPQILQSGYEFASRRGIEMPMSFTDRLEIWDHAADAVGDAPWLGQGLGAVKFLPLTDEQLGRYRYHKAPSTHAHNAALQVWVEFGAVGIAIALALLGAGATALARMDRKAQAVGLTATAALLVIGMLSFGLWQETWLGLIGVTLTLLRLSALPAEREPTA